MTTRPDDEMEAREYVKSQMPNVAEPYASSNLHYANGLNKGYLAGLLAERARGGGTGDDEALADFVTTFTDPVKAYNEGFQTGRKGFVPASEVERMREGLEAFIEAVTPDGCGGYFWRDDAIVDAIEFVKSILTPSGEGEK